MPPFFLRAKFLPWYRSAILATGLGLGIWMWLNGSDPGQPPAGAAEFAWIPLLVNALLLIWWHVQAERAWKAAHQPT